MHLWTGANTLAATAPAVSAHLSHALLSSVNGQRVSRLVQRLHCEHCDALLTLSQVRVRNTFKRTRRSTNPARAVVRTCSKCKRASTVAVATRTEAHEQLKVKRKLKTETAQTTRSRRTRKRRSHGVATPQTPLTPLTPHTPHSGLRAASFLFEPM